MDKRYQVFVSSTYADLREERRAVIQTVIELDCIPAGMELFPAADQEQLEFIKRVIDDCDYYLLIIAGRYGSISETGLSYTEQEYDYAVSRALKVIALVHGNPEDIALGKSEKDPASREKLSRFRDRVCKGRLVKLWTNAGELPGLVALSLSQTIKIFPATGWVRANRVASEEVLSEINQLRKRNTQLEAALADLDPRPALEDLAGLDEPVQMNGHYKERFSNAHRNWSTETTWRKIFGSISPYLLKHPNEKAVKDVMEEALFKASGKEGYGPSLDDQVSQTVGVQLKALGLVNIEYSKSTTGAMAMFWSLTGAGERLMVEIRAVRTKSTAASDRPES